MVERLPDESSGLLVDVGGGPGAYLLTLAGLRPDWRGVALDPSPAVAAAAARRHPTIQAAAAALPLRRASAAGVVVGRALQDLRPVDAAPVASELARVCAPGGRVLVVLDGPRHLAALRDLVDAAVGGPLLGGADRLTLEVAPAALGPYLLTERVDVLADEVVVRSAGPVLTYVRSLRAGLEPRLRGFTGMTMVLARVRSALEEALARDGRWSTETETGVLVCRPA